MANRVYNRYPHLEDSLDYDDLVGTLRESLFDAAKNFNPERGVKFSTYACHVMRNRGIDWVRKERTRIKAESKSIKTTIQEEGRDGTLSKERERDQEESKTSAMRKIQLYKDYADITIKTKKQREIIDIYVNNPTLKREEIATKVGVSSIYVKEVIRRYKTKIGQES